MTNKRYLLILPILILLLQMVACSNDDDYSINDLVGKWECFRMETVTKDAKTGEILYETKTPRRQDGLADSTYTIAFYENGTGQYLDGHSKGEVWQYEVYGSSFVWGKGNHPWVIDELTHDSFVIKIEQEFFNYELEKSIIVIHILGHRKIGN